MEGPPRKAKPSHTYEEVIPALDYVNWFRDEVEVLPDARGPRGERRSSRQRVEPPQFVPLQPAQPPPQTREVVPSPFSDLFQEDSETQVQEPTAADYLAFTIRTHVHWPLEGVDERTVDSDYETCFLSHHQLSRLLRRSGGVFERKSPTVVRYRFTNPKTLLERLGKETTVFTKHRQAGPNHLIMVGPGVPLDIIVRVRRETELFYRASVPDMSFMDLVVDEKVLTRSGGFLCLVDLDDGSIQVARIRQDAVFDDVGNVCLYWYDSWPSCTKATVARSLGIIHDIAHAVCFVHRLCIESCF